LSSAPSRNSSSFHLVDPIDDPLLSHRSNRHFLFFNRHPNEPTFTSFHRIDHRHRHVPFHPSARSPSRSSIGTQQPIPSLSPSASIVADSLLRVDSDPRCFVSIQSIAMIDRPFMDCLSPGTMIFFVTTVTSVAIVIPGIISMQCWIKRSICW